MDFTRADCDLGARGSSGITPVEEYVSVSDWDPLVSDWYGITVNQWSVCVLAEEGCGGSMIVVGTVLVSLGMPMMMVVSNTRSSSWRLKNTLAVRGHHQCFGWSFSFRALNKPRFVEQYIFKLD